MRLRIGDGTGETLTFVGVIGLGRSVTATVDASGTAAGTANCGTSAMDEVRKLVPRCDDYLRPSAPGCVLPYFRTTWSLDTNLHPAAGEYHMIEVNGGRALIVL
ncbi:hypothetical protein [Streptomyces xantholiticus]|uniref:Uncharacterized protein n=1 Tax=Streptomyces xantholiticus TaxID=68285 RepID=A0ABV1V3D3_9ACTN